MPITDYAFQELNEGSGRGRLPSDGEPSEFTRVFKIAWTDLSNFLLALKGGWKRLNSTTFTWIVPDKHPQFSNAFCRVVEYEGIGQTSWDGVNLSSWSYAKVTATYSTARPELGQLNPANIIEEEFDFGMDILSLPAGSLESVDGDAVDFPATLKVPTLIYTITMPAIPELPGGNIQTVMALLGRMNSASFGGAAKAHMLFLGMKASRKGAVVLTTDNSVMWNCQLKFAYRDQHQWDELYIPDVGWKQVVYKDTGDPLYDSGNLNVLLPNGSTAPPP